MSFRTSRSALFSRVLAGSNPGPCWRGSGWPRRPVLRRVLAAEMFGEANDPLAALRWSLADLRRALGRVIFSVAIH